MTVVLVAAVVTFVVSLSVALGLRLAPDSASEQPQVATAGDEPAAVTKSPSTVAHQPPSPPTSVLPRDARPVVAQTIAVVVPPAAEPVYEPPAAPSPPAPVAVPPAPNYVPPVPVQPRLRDRIIERIPIINRFHEPEYQAPR